MPKKPDHEGGEVIELQHHPAYRPDLAALARHQVLQAREQLGLDRAAFADRLARLLTWTPSADLIEGWETQATPPGDVLLAVAVAAQASPHEIVALPLTDDARRVVGLVSSVMGEVERIAGSPDVVRVHAMRGVIGRADWNDAIRDADEHLWLYGMAEMGYAVDDQTPSILEAAANRGCDIKVLLLDPSYPAINDLDQDEGNPAGTLGPGIRAAHARFTAMRGRCGDCMQIRVYNAPPTVSIVRADNRMLVTPYMRFFAGSNSPTFELVRVAESDVFSRYVRHFDSMWSLAKEWHR